MEESKDKLAAWADTFPPEFYKQLGRLLTTQSAPACIPEPEAINRLVFDRLPPHVVEELRQKAPGGPQPHHPSFPASGIPHPQLGEHVAQVIIRMRGASSWSHLERLVEQAFPLPDTPEASA
jgi:P63C domain